jgi:hypothetical protein
MIPRIISDHKPQKKSVNRVFLHSLGNTKVKIITQNEERTNKCFIKRSGSFPRISGIADEYQMYSQQINLIIQKKVKKMIDAQLIVKVGD